MTDYKQEQRDEIEAIESIYSEEISVISENPHRFTIPVKTEGYDEDEGEGWLVLLKFTFPAESDSIEDDLLLEFKEAMGTVAEESLGMAMLFTIVFAGIEWLGETNDRLKREAEEERRKLEEEEEDRKKLEGTKVAIESWKWPSIGKRMGQLRTKSQKSHRVRH